MLSALIKTWRRSLSLRIAVLFTFTFVVAISAAFLFAYLKLSYSLEQSSREVLMAKHREAAVIIENDGIRGLREFLSIDKNHVLYAPYMYRVLTQAGETVYLKPSVQDKNFDFESAFKQQDPQNMVGWKALPAINDEDQFDIYTEKAGKDVYLEIGKSSEDRNEVLEQITGVFIVTGILFVLMSGGLGLWYAHRALKPVRELVTTIARIENGNLSQRVVVDESDDELNELGKTFNRMIARIEKLIVIMKESLDNVAHDIRTPLTRIKAVAEDALVSSKPIALQEALADCAENVTLISEMVNQLMSISEAESGTLALHYEDVNVGEMLRQVVDIYDFVAQEKSISVVTSTSHAGLTWRMDSKRIKQVLANLLDNALKFSLANTHVELTASVENAQLVLHVTDQGPGIPEADIDRIWERLFRGDKSRSTKGSGLGLSIARAIVLAHSGQIDVVSKLNQGATFTVRLPS